MWGFVLLGGTFLFSCGKTARPLNWLDFSHAMIVSADSDSSTLREKALGFFQEEVSKRTGRTLPRQEAFLKKHLPAVVVATDLKALKPIFAQSAQWQSAKDTLGNEGFLVRQVRISGIPTLCVVANTNRGLLFGLSWLIRQMDWSKGKLRFPSNLAIATRPQTLIRGHQLAYRPLSNTYDAWTLRQYGKYIRDLIIFGTNTIELVVTAKSNPKNQILMKQPPDEMNRALSQLIHSYGLKVSVWSNAADGDYRDPAQMAKALRLREKWLKSLPFVDDWFVPGGDPGKQPLRISWWDQAETLYKKPLEMRYTGLDTAAIYRLRVIYTGRFHATMSLTANDSIVIHGSLKQPRLTTPLEFELPRRATRSGTLELT